MARLLLTDEEWELIADSFPPAAKTGRPRRDPRSLLDGILWVLRTGSPWHPTGHSGEANGKPRQAPTLRRPQVSTAKRD